MPRGVPNHPRKTHVIDIALEEPTRMTPALGQVDRLLKQSLLETQSLQVVRHMLMRDTLERAQATGSTKLLAAANMRTERRAEVNGNGHEGELPFEEAGVRKAKKPRKTKANFGQGARETEQLAKVAITGPRLNLFLLERLVESGEYLSGQQLFYDLKGTGKADHIKRLSGVFGLLSNEGLVKHTHEGYRILSAGKTFAARLRQTLEAANECVPGQYVAPPDFKLSTKTKRVGWKTMSRHMGGNNKTH